MKSSSCTIIMHLHTTIYVANIHTDIHTTHEHKHIYIQRTKFKEIKITLLLWKNNISREEKLTVNFQCDNLSIIYNIFLNEPEYRHT